MLNRVEEAGRQEAHQLGTQSFKTKSAAETALKGMSECKA